jgi:hypothetical protein
MPPQNNFVKNNDLIEWETIMTIVRKEVEPREYRGDFSGAKQMLEQLPQQDGFVLKKWGDVLFKEAQKDNDLVTAQKALEKALSAEAAFPNAKYKHEAKLLQGKIRKWIDQLQTA